MSSLNLKQLRYFWAVATHGSIASGSEVLYLTPQTISGQLCELEQQLKTRLFQKSGRNLVLTDTGRVVFSYADEMFRLGDELQDVLAGRTPGSALTLTVGVAMVVPKLLAYRVLRNTYALLALTLLFSSVTAGISMALNLPHPGLLLTLAGYFGLLQLNPQWLAVKEAAIPGLIGIAVLVSTRTRYPLIRTLLYNPAVMDVRKIEQKLESLGNTAALGGRMLNATYLLGCTFIFSALMNYTLARWIVTSPVGSTAFNVELGRLTLLSYPVIAIPSMLMMLAIFYCIWRAIHGMTGFPIKEIMVSLRPQNEDDNVSS